MHHMALAGIITCGIIMGFSMLCCLAINDHRDRIERLQNRQSLAELEKFKKDLVKKLVENYEKHQPAKKTTKEEVVETWIANTKAAQEPIVDKPAATIKADNKVAPEIMTQDQRIIYIPTQLPVLEAQYG